MILKIFVLYIILALLWSFYAVYRNRQLKNGKLIKTQWKSFYINFLLFPKAIYFFIKYEL